MSKKVFVTGCFDMLHSGHVAFLKEASSFGNLYVCIGNDENVKQLKGRYPVTNQQERQYMLGALSCVYEVRINSGYGLIDFENELQEIQPDIFIVNEDGHTPVKQHLCEQLKIEYKVLQRLPEAGLPVRSTTALRTVCTIPFRIDIAGGWLDQPYVSRHHAGDVLTVSIEPVIDFNDRSGMASSTRRKAIELWKTEIPAGEREQLAKVLFAYENPPGTNEISGSQDSIGIVFPGFNRLHYNGNYWPEHIETVDDEKVLQWLESHLHLLTLGPRSGGYSVLDNTNITDAGARNLAEAAVACWKAALEMNLEKFGQAFTSSFNAQVAMFPNMIDDEIKKIINTYKPTVAGYKLSGAGGGGYLVLVSDNPPANTIKINIRRKHTVI